jgi:hypothetical protein
VNEVGRRPHLVADEPRCEPEVVVLESRDACGIVAFLEDRVGEAAVDRPVVVPDGVVVVDLREKAVTEWPQHPVAEAVVVAVQVRVVEPDAPVVLRRVVRRYGHPVVLVDDDIVGRSAAPSHPRPFQGAHHGVERRSQALGRETVIPSPSCSWPSGSRLEATSWRSAR